MAIAVFDVGQSREEDRPRLLQKCSQLSVEQDDKNVACILGQPEGRGDLWTPVEFRCRRRGTTSLARWHAYEADYGLMLSQQALDLLKPYFGDRLVPLPASVDGRPYYCFWKRRLSDCLNRELSGIEYFDEDSGGGIMSIDPYVFRKDAIDDPAVFAIPEQPRLLFATEAIPQIVAEAGLKGLRFLMVDGPPQVATDVYTYRNEYFGFEVDIPDSYTVLTWRLGNMPPGTLDEPSTFQTADDDLPSNIGGYRRLFLARMYRPHDKALLDGEIALSVTKRDLDPKRELRALRSTEFFQIVDRGKWAVNDRPGEFVDAKHGIDGGMRIAYIPAKKGLWLKVDIKGVTNGYFREAVAAIESMRPI